MGRRLVIIGALAVSFAAGYVLASVAPWKDAADDVNSAPAATPADAPAAYVLPVAAREAWFPPLSDYDTGGEALTDEKFDGLLAMLAERLQADETLADFDREAKIYLHSFMRRLLISELTPEQTEKAGDYMTRLAEQHPEHETMIAEKSDNLEYYAPANENPMFFSMADEWFPHPDTLKTHGQPFKDATVDELLGVLDALLTMPETLANFEQEAMWSLTLFNLSVREGLLTDTQTERIVTYLNDVKARHPEASQLFERHTYQLANLSPGNIAPNIVGTDLDEVQFELNDYRGNIVVIYFSGQWCGPCRLEYPYQRLMLELFEDQRVTILGVNSDEEIDTAREAKEEERLDYRVWWDGHGEISTQGPIAMDWNIIAWPTIYILDEKGVIRYINKNKADVISAVNGLIMERFTREAQTGTAGA